VKERLSLADGADAVLDSKMAGVYKVTIRESEPEILL
jgi:hypothetical protein